MGRKLKKELPHFSSFLAITTATTAFALLPAGSHAQAANETTPPSANAPARHRFVANLPANPALPTLHLVGDSTLKPGRSTDGKVGWAERIQPYFDTNKINIVNDAIAGRSARTFYTEGRWQRVLDSLKPGDVVIIQFGTNDGGRIGDPKTKHRPDGKGIGDETVEDTLPDGTKQQVHTFGWYMADFVATGQAKGASVILVSPIPHNGRWATGRDFENFAEWDSEVAKAHHAPFFDLTMVITDGFRKIGKEKVASFYVADRTHTTDAGAQFNAKCVIAGLKSLANDPLAPYFSEKAKAVEPYQPEPTTETPNTK